MFLSFFPSPRLFFISALFWSALAVAVWYGLGETLGAAFGFAPPPADAAPVIGGLGYFTMPQFIWFYLYYAAATALFTAFWFRLAPHPWQRWSVLGSSAILFSTYFSVQVSVAINVSRLAPVRHALVYRLSELGIAYRGRGVALARPDDYIAYSTPIRRRHRSIGKGAFGFGEPDKLDGADAGSRECRKKSMPP